ncbi:VRR-NUC domain-containing protein [Clostridium coskatii]|uniref:VRR-NUC domain protein n=1 Tax=Clostridium coskatii TaxID=1705578 RepID=A0A162JEN8_9CLOT|nr:VRR-NUC domain-containing protein [Clostridium coskatii]OAA94105.1 VRR-NUC domain protein [Clostridium coskatii]OBR96667.1 VRR-NUC domain protein [Clostridium coskatii]
MRKNELPVASESVEQICLFRWAAYEEGKYPELALMHHIPNGGKRNITTAKRLKLEGVKSGVPDISLPVARNGFHGLYIELKKKKGNGTTKNQDCWLKSLNAQGYYAIVCKGWEEASKEILDYLGEGEMI